MFKRHDLSIGLVVRVRDHVAMAQRSIREWTSKLPKGAHLVIIDDGSVEPFPGATFRFERSVGDARAKNRGLLELEKLGVEHAFVSSFNIFPTSPYWYKPYVESREPHLVRIPQSIHEIHRDDEHVAFTQYFEGLTYLHLPTILGSVGGFDASFGFGGGEGEDLAERVHAAGLTTWKIADVLESRRLWDAKTEGQTQVTSRAALMIQDRRGVARYAPYQEAGVSVPSTKTGTIIRVYPSSDLSNLTPWLEEIESTGAKGVVISDHISKLPRGYGATRLVKPVSGQVSIESRWRHYRDFLLRNPDVQWAWIVDRVHFSSVDDPFKDLFPSRLYIKAEDTNVGCSWMRENHRANRLRSIISEYSSLPLLNSAVVGGERSLLIELASKMESLRQEIIIDRDKGEDETPSGDAGDMASFNGICYEYFSARLSTENKGISY